MNNHSWINVNFFETCKFPVLPGKHALEPIHIHHRKRRTGPHTRTRKYAKSPLISLTSCRQICEETVLLPLALLDRSTCSTVVLTWWQRQEPPSRSARRSPENRHAMLCAVPSPTLCLHINVSRGSLPEKDKPSMCMRAVS